MMVEEPQPEAWQRADDNIREALTGDSRRPDISDGDTVVGWRHSETGEVVVIHPIKGDDDSLPDEVEYTVYRYTEFKYSEVYDRYHIQYGSLLFRSDSVDDAVDRITEWMDQFETPENPEDRHNTAIDVVEVRRHEITHPTTLEEWAMLTGAEYYTSEKIGNRKRSGGQVAMFGGTHRWGEGAYISLASVDGPGGDNYASVGYEPDGYYTTDKQLTSRGYGSDRAFEITDPVVEFDGDTIHISERRGDKEITVTAQTENPAENLHQSE
jgi:hypothetical protein